MNRIPRRADTLYCDLFVPEETRRIRREVRQFCDDVVRPVAHRLNTTPESKDGFARAEFEAMARAGLYKIPFTAGSARSASPWRRRHSISRPTT